MKISSIPFDKEEADQEKALLARVLGSYKKEIAEIREAYKLLLAIIELFKQTFPSVDSQLSTHYIDLFALTERNVKTIEDEIEFRYDPNTNHGRNMSADFIHTDIYQGFFRPFTNLYDGKIAIEESKTNWNDLQKQMNDYYSQVDTIYHKYHTDDLKQLPNQSLFKAVTIYLRGFPRSLSKVSILQCGGLSLDLKRGLLRYKDNRPKEVSLDHQLIKLLILLLQNKGEIIEYVAIAQELKPNFYHEGLTNKDLGEDMRYLKKDLRTLLKSIGMLPDEFKTLITTQKNLGYKLNGDS